MKLKIKDMDVETGGPLVAVMHVDDAKMLDFHHGDRVRPTYNDRKAVSILNLAESKRSVPIGSIGCYEEVLRKLGAKGGQKVGIALEEKPASVQYIKKKLNGGTLTYKEFYQIVSDISQNKLNDIELTYFVSACHTNVMTLRETIDLTKAMIATGDVLKLKKKPVIDKHCVGGVAGNRTTMIIVPILAAAGLTVPKTSSRSITSPAGTADTVEVLTKVSFNVDRMKKIVNKIGACMVWGGSINLAPADDRIIRVEHPLSIDSRSQLLASIIAKKASVSATHVLVYIPVGRGAKIETMDKARDLKRQFEVIGRSVGISIKVIITDGSQPIGNGLGPALEARDVMWILRNDEKGPRDLRKKSVMMAGLILEMAGKARKGQGKEKALDLLESGKAYKKMQEIIRAQGGKVKRPEDLPIAKFAQDVFAAKSGRITHIDNTYISKIARAAGAPRDSTAGVYLYLHKNDLVKKGEILFTIYSNSRQRLDFAREQTRLNVGFEIK